MRQLRVRRRRDVRSRERREGEERETQRMMMRCDETFVSFFQLEGKIKTRRPTDALEFARWMTTQEHQQTREELLNRVHALKSELQEWRYKMDGQVKNYKGELAALKETLASETGALRRELEETNERLKRQAVTTRDEHHHSTQSPGGRLHRVSSPP
jgi:chromosome segregation ATPase